VDKLVVIIVNWNTGELLARCLGALARLPERELITEVIVVDNASRDRSLAKAKLQVAENGNRPPVRFIQLEHNTGFARANNVALKRVYEGQHAEAHVLLLNPDTEVRPGALTALLDVFDIDQAAGIVGPQLLNADGTVQPSVRSFPTLGVFVFLFLKLHRLLPRAVLWQRYVRSDFDYGSRQVVDQVMGAAFLIRNTVLAKIGDLDERFWVWFEEVDLCKRAQQAGWRVAYTPKAQVLHHGAASFNQLVGWRRSLPWFRSSLAYANKHLGSGATALLWLLLPLAVLLAVPSVIAHVLVREQNSEKLS